MYSNPRWPGFLDNTIAGGIPSGMSPFESLVKEAMEEGSLQEDVVRKHTRAVGSISYFYQSVFLAFCIATNSDLKIERVLAICSLRFSKND